LVLRCLSTCNLPFPPGSMTAQLIAVTLAFHGFSWLFSSQPLIPFSTYIFPFPFSLFPPITKFLFKPKHSIFPLAATLALSPFLKRACRVLEATSTLLPKVFSPPTPSLARSSFQSFSSTRQQPTASLCHQSPHPIHFPVPHGRSTVPRLGQGNLSHCSHTTLRDLIVHTERAKSADSRRPSAAVAQTCQGCLQPVNALNWIPN